MKVKTLKNTVKALGIAAYITLGTGTGLIINHLAKNKPPKEAVLGLYTFSTIASTLGLGFGKISLNKKLERIYSHRGVNEFNDLNTTFRYGLIPGDHSKEYERVKRNIINKIDQQEISLRQIANY